MGPLDLLLHLLSFLGPAVAVSVMVALAGPLLMPGSQKIRSWWAYAAMNSVAGTGVLLAGLWFWGTDGKMATYAALVGVVASCQWLSSRAWRG
jgi:hypothetical protein